MNPYTQSEKADTRFISGMLSRYGSVNRALQEARWLRQMAPEGQVWWCYIEARLAYLIVEGK